MSDAGDRVNHIQVLAAGWFLGIGTSLVGVGVML